MRPGRRYCGVQVGDLASQSGKSQTADEYDVQKLIIINRLAWPPGKEMRIAFIETRTQFQEDTFKAAIGETNGPNGVATGQIAPLVQANLTISYPADVRDANVRIQWDKSASPAFGGTAFLGHPSVISNDQGPSMRLTNFFETQAQADADPDGQKAQVGTILHEFLHILGFDHENKAPDAFNPIEFKTAQQIADIQLEVEDPADPGGIRQTAAYQSFLEFVETQVLGPLSNAAITTAPTYDPQSIMQYPIPAKWTTNGVGWDAFDELSQTDIEFLTAQYSRPIPPPEEDDDVDRELTPIEQLQQEYEDLKKAASDFTIVGAVGTGVAVLGLAALVFL